MKRKSRETLRTVLAFVPLLALLVAVAYWMFGPDEHDHAGEQQGIAESLEDYYRKR